MEYLIGLIIALVGALFYQTTKRNSAEALVQNTKVKDDLNKDNVVVSKDSGLLEAEAQKRSEIQQSSQPNTNLQDDISDLANFLNNKK